MTLELTHSATQMLLLSLIQGLEISWNNFGKRIFVKLWEIAEQLRTQNDINNSCPYDNDVLEETKNKSSL